LDAFIYFITRVISHTKIKVIYKVGCHDNQACVQIKVQDSPLVCNVLQYLVSQIFDSYEDPKHSRLFIKAE